MRRIWRQPAGENVQNEKDTDLVDGKGRDNNGRSDDGRFDDLPPVDVVVPDDASELVHEARAVQRELHREQLRASVARPFLTSRWRRFGLSGPLIVVVLLLVGLVASTLGVLRPRQAAQRPAALPLAETTAPTGEIGGLLPAGEITARGATFDSRALRPAVLVVVPAECRCDQLLDTVFRQAQEYGLAMYVIGGDGAATVEVNDLARGIGNGTAVSIGDENRTLSTMHDGSGVTAILVHADGVIRAIHRDLPMGVRLEPDLALLSSRADQ